MAWQLCMFALCFHIISRIQGRNVAATALVLAVAKGESHCHGRFCAGDKRLAFFFVDSRDFTCLGYQLSVISVISVMSVISVISV